MIDTGRVPKRIWKVTIKPNRNKAQRFFYDKPFTFSVMARSEDEVEDKVYKLYPDVRANRLSYIMQIFCKE